MDVGLTITPNFGVVAGAPLRPAAAPPQAATAADLPDTQAATPAAGSNAQTRQRLAARTLKRRTMLENHHKWRMPESSAAVGQALSSRAPSCSFTTGKALTRHLVSLPLDGPDIPRVVAPEVQRILAQRFSAGNRRHSIRSPVGTALEEAKRDDLPASLSRIPITLLCSP